MSMSQTTSHIMMIRPKHFGFNIETAENNSFQSNDTTLSIDEISAKAIDEFDGFVASLRQHQINVHVIEDTDEPIKTDAVFPNNWISFHDDGMVMQYPMFSLIRRKERRQDIIDQLKRTFNVQKEYTFEHYEEEDLYLEGTGSLILDRVNRIVYANLSVRTDLQLLDKWAILMRYERRVFLAKDRTGQDIYHTNVVMALGTHICIICLECIPEGREKDRLIESLQATNKTILDISLKQLEHFAGNMLEVKNDFGQPFMVMSKSAHHVLTKDQISLINLHNQIIIGDIPTIERYGGGSVRCMMAEIFLPLKK
jgi:hypothetical protein